MIIGIISSVSLPMIGIFDMYKWMKPHGVFAVLFFLCFGAYSVMVSNAMAANISKYPADEQPEIQTL
jgi:hypothetical membrane protein